MTHGGFPGKQKAGRQSRPQEEASNDTVTGIYPTEVCNAGKAAERGDVGMDPWKSSIYLFLLFVRVEEL